MPVSKREPISLAPQTLGGTMAQQQQLGGTSRCNPASLSVGLRGYRRGRHGHRRGRTHRKGLTIHAHDVLTLQHPSQPRVLGQKADCGDTLRPMPNSNFLKRLMDAGVTFGEVTQTKADEIAKMLKDSGVKRKDAEATVAALADQARTHTDRFVSKIKSEMADQIVVLADRIDALEDRLEHLADRASARLRSDAAADAPVAKSASATPATTAGAVAKAAPTKKAAAAKRTAATKKPAATRTAAPATKPAAVTKKSPAPTKAAAKKAVAKEAAAKNTTAAKKPAAAKRAPAKRTTAK